MNYNLFKSRTFWTIVAMFIVGGGNAILPVLPANWDTIIMFALSALGTYFHLDTAIKAGATN